MYKLFPFSVSVPIALQTLILAGFGSWLSFGSQAQSSWVKQPPDFNAVGFGNNLFVAAGAGGAISTSPDGIAWQTQNSGTTNSLKGIAFGGGRFVAVGENGRIKTSSDGVAWLAQESHTSMNLSGITFGKGRFVAVGDGPVGQIRSSLNGEDWVEQVNGVDTTQSLIAVTFGKVDISGTPVDLFIAVGKRGTVYTSADAQTWSSVASVTSATLNGVASGDGILVASGYASSGRIVRSDNGSDWTTETGINAPNALRGINFGNHTFVAVGDASEIKTSPDGITWTHRQTPYEAFGELFFTSVAFGNNTFVAAGLRGIIFTSTEGQDWTPRASSPGSVTAVAYGRLFVAVGEPTRGNSVLQTSVDGVLWTDRESGTTLPLNGVAYGKAMYVVVGNGIILNSTDGVHWTKQSTLKDTWLYGVVFGNGRFVAAGSDPADAKVTRIHTSTDGVTWVDRSLDVQDFKAITYANNLFVMVGNHGIVTSPNGIDWTLRFTSSSHPLSSVAYGNHTFTAVGFNPFSDGKHGIIVTSTDGVAWTPQAEGLFDSLVSVAFGNNTLVAVGSKGTDVVITSSNGVDWSSAAVPFRTDPTAVTFGRGRFVSVGQLGVLTSGAFQPISQLPAFGQFGYSITGPVRSSSGWHFLALLTSDAPDVAVRVQSTLAPQDEGTWTDLPGGSFMARIDSKWTLDTTDVPTGKRYFRAIASATDFLDRTSVVTEPATVLEGIAPFGDFSYSTTSPLRTGTGWTFTIDETSLVSDLRLRVQSSTTWEVESSWSDLPGGGKMSHLGSHWTYVTSEVPLGKVYFRIVASAPTYADRVSAVLGPLTIGTSLPVEHFTITGPARYSIASLPTFQDPHFILAKYWGEEAVEYIMESSDRDNIIKDTLAFEAVQNAAVRLTVKAGEILTIPAVNIGDNASLIVKGTINGSVSLLLNQVVPVVSNDGNSLIAQDGGTLQAIRNSGALQSTLDAPLISQDGGTLISQDGGTLHVPIGSGFSGTGSAALQLPNSTASAKAVLQGTQAAASSAFTGLMTINGDFRQESGTGIAIAIAGKNTISTGSQEYDQLVVSGRAELGGVIGFGFFNPSDPTRVTGIFQPVVGDTFDVVVAGNIVRHSLIVRGPIWGDGLHFNWSVVNRSDGKQALRLVATRIAPFLVIQPKKSGWEVAYSTNFTGYSIQRSSSLGTPNWTGITSSTNRVEINPANASGFYRLMKQF